MQRAPGYPDSIQGLPKEDHLRKVLSPLVLLWQSYQTLLLRPDQLQRAEEGVQLLLEHPLDCIDCAACDRGRWCELYEKFIQGGSESMIESGLGLEVMEFLEAGIKFFDSGK